MPDKAEILEEPTSEEPFHEVDSAVVADLLDSGATVGAIDVLRELESSDRTLVLTRLSNNQRCRVVRALHPDEAASLLERLPEPVLVQTIAGLEPAIGAKVVAQFPSAARADLIGDLDHEAAIGILDHLATREAEDVRRLTSYEDDVAGGLMLTEYLAYPSGTTIAEVIADLGVNAERYTDYDIQYVYVVDPSGHLMGVLRLRDLLLSPRMRPVEDIMIASALTVRDLEPLEDLVRFFDEHKFFGVPVVDAEGHLVGVVRRDAVEAMVAERGERAYRSAQGIVGGEELRTMPIFVRSRRRLAWLSVNIVLNIAAASVIALHQETLEAVIALAVFLPIISDMSGCSGNQAVAVSTRELTLGVTRPTELMRTVFGEASVGLINGAVLGSLIGLVAWLWKGNVWLGLVVGGALGLNTLVAVVIGGSVPLVLKRFKVDPAIAAGPILTTVTDMCGFFIVLTFASVMLGRIV